MPDSLPAQNNGVWTVAAPKWFTAQIWLTDEMIERGAKAIHYWGGWSATSYASPECRCRERSEACLRAALEAPDER